MKSLVVYGIKWATHTITKTRQFHEEDYNGFHFKHPVFGVIGHRGKYVVYPDRDPGSAETRELRLLVCASSLHSRPHMHMNSTSGAATCTPENTCARAHGHSRLCLRTAVYGCACVCVRQYVTWREVNVKLQTLLWPLEESCWLRRREPRTARKCWRQAGSAEDRPEALRDSPEAPRTARKRRGQAGSISVFKECKGRVELEVETDDVEERSSQGSSPVSWGPKAETVPEGEGAKAELTGVPITALRFPRARWQSAKTRGREDGVPAADGLI